MSSTAAPSSTNALSATASGSSSGQNHISIPANAPAGGMTFTDPPATAAVSYYKLAPSQPLTFGWNLTSLYVTPDSLTFSAFCSSNGNTYPVGPTVVAATANKITWDPWTYQTGAQGIQTPLVQGTYTLMVQDSHGTSQVGKAGLFNYNNNLQFALYTPQPYTPLSQWTCAACNSAGYSVTPSPAFFGVVATMAVMVLSGWGLLRNMLGQRPEEA